MLTVKIFIVLNILIFSGDIFGQQLVVEISNCTVSGTIKAVFSVQNETAKGVNAGALVGQVPTDYLVGGTGNTTTNAVVIPENN